MKILNAFFLLFLLITCKNDHHYGRVALLNMALEWEKRQWRKMGIKDKDFALAAKNNKLFELILAERLGDGPSCKSYGEGCIGAKVAKVSLATFIIVEYQNEGQAKQAALQLDQYYKYNWLFDEVKGEPVVTYFVKDAFGAVRAKTEKK